MNAACLQPSVRRLNVHYFVIQMGFWAMYAAICGYQVALLQGRGFTNSQIGLVIAVRCVAGILCQPVMGGFADRHCSFPLKYIISISLSISLCAGIALIAVPMGLGGVLLVFFVLGGFEVSAYPFMDSMAIQYINAGVPIRYSLGRGAGSLSYAVVSILLGLAVGRWGVEVTLPIHALFMGMEIVIILLFPTFRAAACPEDKPRPSPQSALSLLRTNPRFTLMLAGVFLGISCMFPMSNFLVNILQSRGGTASYLGPALFLMAVFELPSAFLFPRLYRRFGSRRMMFVSVCFIAVKALLLLATTSAVGVLLVQPIQIAGYGLFIPTSVYYVNETVPEADRVRGQSLLMVASNGFGGVFGNLASGRIVDSFGVNGMLIFCLLSGSAGAALCLLAGRARGRGNSDCI